MKPRPSIDRRVRWLLLLILVVGALLRLTYLLESLRAPDFRMPQFESQYHDYWARALASGDWTVPAGVTDPEIRERPYFRPPGYPHVLSWVYAFTGFGYVWPRVFQLLLGLLSCVLVFNFTRRYYGDPAGLGAAALMSTYWLFLFFEMELMAPTLLIFLLLLALTVVARWSDGITPRRALAAGFLLGLAALVRPNVLALPPVYLLWAAWVEHRRGKSAKNELGGTTKNELGGTFRRRTFRRLLHQKFLVPVGLFLFAVLLPIGMTALRNVEVAEDLVWITSNAGINLFVGTHPDSDGMTPGVPELGQLTGMDGWDSFDYPKIARAVERQQGRSMKDSEVSKYFSRRAFAHFGEEPRAVVRLTLRKLALFWGPAEVSNNKVLSAVRANSPTLAMAPGFATVLALALLGFFFLAARRLPQHNAQITALLLVTIAVYSATYLPFFVAARFRAPVVPFLIILAGIGIGGLWTQVQEKKAKALVASLALLAVLRALTGIEWVPYDDNPALWHWRRGLLYQTQNNRPLAIEEFQQTLNLDPRHPEAHLLLADILAAEGRLTEALHHYRQNLQRNPRSVETLNNLGLLLARSGNLAQAIEHWEAALKIDPQRVSVRTNLAHALRTVEDPELRDEKRALELAQ